MADARWRPQQGRNTVIESTLQIGMIVSFAFVVAAGFCYAAHWWSERRFERRLAAAQGATAVVVPRPLRHLTPPQGMVAVPGLKVAGGVLGSSQRGSSPMSSMKNVRAAMQ